MPALEVSDLKQKAVLWVRTGYDNFGQPTVSNKPVEIRCRWTWTHREIVDPQGNTIAIDANVAVAQDIPENSHLWLGTLKEWNALHSGASQPDQNLCEVKVVKKTPDVKGRVRRRELSLMRLHDSGAN